MKISNRPAGPSAASRPSQEPALLEELEDRLRACFLTMNESSIAALSQEQQRALIDLLADLRNFLDASPLPVGSAPCDGGGASCTKLLYRIAKWMREYPNNDAPAKDAFRKLLHLIDAGIVSAWDIELQKSVHMLRGDGELRRDLVQGVLDQRLKYFGRTLGLESFPALSSDDVLHSLRMLCMRTAAAQGDRGDWTRTPSFAAAADADRARARNESLSVEKQMAVATALKCIRLASPGQTDLVDAVVSALKGGNGLLGGAVQTLLKYGILNPNAPDDAGRTLLHRAAARGCLARVLRMGETGLPFGLDVTARDHAGKSVFEHLYEAEDVGCMQLLLFHPDPALRVRLDSDSRGVPWPERVFEDGESEVMGMLARAGLPLGRYDAADDANLLDACSRGEVGRARFLLECGARVAARNADGQGALHLARNAILVDVLLGFGQREVLLAPDHQGRTPFHTLHDRDTARELLDALPDESARRKALNRRDKLGNTPLAYALQKNDDRLADLLRSRGAKLRWNNLR